MSIKKNIAKAIRKADKSYFFEDYDKQAVAVIQMLKKDGYVIVPLEPSEETLRKAADTIATGKMRPEQHILNVHKTLANLLKQE